MFGVVFVRGCISSAYCEYLTFPHRIWISGTCIVRREPVICQCQVCRGDKRASLGHDLEIGKRINKNPCFLKVRNKKFSFLKVGAHSYGQFFTLRILKVRVLLRLVGGLPLPMGGDSENIFVSPNPLFGPRTKIAR